MSNTKITLLLENQELELTENIAFPLNKTFENLWNPTDIIVDYSKSIKIPATMHNNKILGNAYRIDRQYVINDGNYPNIGMYLDPMKRIPMKLLHNGKIILDGYAKYASATVNATETFYTFNIYGVLGDIFQKLLDCVVDDNKLTDEQRAESDGGLKYVIQCPWEKRLINKEFIKASWDNTHVDFDYSYDPHNNIGFAPAYRGFYSDFESTSALGLDYIVLDGIPTETKSVEDALKREWVFTLINGGYTADDAQARVDALDFNMIIPKGLSEHNMRQFRSYEQKPYIYFSALMKLYQNKCKELTGYTINLDPHWFSVNNPYWAKLCYMFDYLSVKGVTTDASLPFTGYSEQQFRNEYCQSSATYNITDNSVLSKGNINIDPFTLGLRVKHDVFGTPKNPETTRIEMQYESHVTLDIAITTGGKTTHKYFWGGIGTPDTYPEGGPSGQGNYKNSEYIYMTERTEYNQSTNRYEYTAYLSVPSFTVDHNAGDDISITYNAQFVSESDSTGDRRNWTVIYTSSDGKEYRTGIPLKDGIGVTNVEWKKVINNDDYKFIFPNITYSSNWRISTTCDLKNLYTKDDPLFNVILQYTKMFGLIWKPDYQNKTIDIMTRKSYFKDYNIVDWTDKVDKSKGLTIEPVSFASKYVTFNYEDVSGYRYSGYKNKYGVDYGEKKLVTKYNFDTKEEKLFKQKIYPSSLSCKGYTNIEDLLDWNTLSTIPIKASDINFIDCEDENEENAISLNNWYFRCDNVTTTNNYYISDASERELNSGKYYWVANTIGLMLNCVVKTNTLPQFSVVVKSDVNNETIGCLFNCPNDDYTKDFQISTAKDSFIYDICWKDFINERYNANNKKVTAYVKLSPVDYENFNFKTFVMIDNQLFVVNKVFDYDVNNTTTKVEFIQVTNITGYTKQKVEFPTVVYDKEYINIGSLDGVGSSSLKIISWPTINSVGRWEIVPISTKSSVSTCFVEGGDLDGYEFDMAITYESDDDYVEEYELRITAFGETKTIPIYINQ